MHVQAQYGNHVGYIVTQASHECHGKRIIILVMQTQSQGIKMLQQKKVVHNCHRRNIGSG